jgi:hypothetical protein
MDHGCLLDTPEEELPLVRVRRARMYVDCNSSGPRPRPRANGAAVGLYGTGRIVCGTYGSAFGVDWTRKALEEARIGEAEREMILTRNAAAMLARAGKGAVRERVAVMRR